MKFRNFGRIALASVVSLSLGFGITACGPSNTVDFLYVTNSKPNPGEINVYQVDSESGSLIPIQDSPYQSGGRDPVADAASPNGKNLYVINNMDNTVVEFAIGTDGKLYPQQTCNTPGSYPMQLAVSPGGTYLYIVETYQPNYSTNVPGPGALVVFPINSNGGLGANNDCTPVADGANPYFPVGDDPVAVNVLASNNYLYVVNQTDATLSEFQIGSGSVLTSIGTVSVGVSPSAIASSPTNQFVYVTDSAANQLIGFLVQTNGTLVPMQQVFATDIFPDAVTVSPNGAYIYVANYNAGDVNAYNIDLATGAATANATATYAVNSGPTCILIDPSLGRYLYTTNYLGNTVTGVYVNPDTGSLSGVQNSPFKAVGQPTCAAAVTHGNHATQSVEP